MSWCCVTSLRQASSEVVLGLVGKGITFDTGGISIKPADNMDKMKDDMSGGAAVICAMSAIARLKLPIRCIAVIPMTENMPGGQAVKPGDVLTSAEGKTVEILNTDAEGRLILGDGLWLARQRGATHLVDLATLTGACVVALGKTTSGLFGTPPAWVEDVRRATERAGDRSWPMPVFDDYKEQLKSEIADLSNTGGRPGGAITAALFIKEFTGDLPWVHMDIAGTAWAEEPKPYQPKGATGVGVRTLVELARDVGVVARAGRVRCRVVAGSESDHRRRRPSAGSDRRHQHRLRRRDVRDGGRAAGRRGRRLPHRGRRRHLHQAPPVGDG